MKQGKAQTFFDIAFWYFSVFNVGEVGSGRKNSSRAHAPAPNLWSVAPAASDGLFSRHALSSFPDCPTSASHFNASELETAPTAIDEYNVQRISPEAVFSTIIEEHSVLDLHSFMHSLAPLETVVPAV